MWIRMFALTLVLMGSFALAACGGGNDSNKKDDDKCCGGEEDKPKTPAEKREALANKMVVAGKTADEEKILALFPEDEHELVKQRIVAEMKTMKEDKVEFDVKVAEITETEGKFYVFFEFTIQTDDGPKTEKNKLAMVEKDGKWWLSFNG